MGAIDGAREADGVCGRVEGVAGGRISHPNNADRIADSEGSVWRNTFCSSEVDVVSFSDANSGSLTEFNVDVSDCT